MLNRRNMITLGLASAVAGALCGTLRGSANAQQATSPTPKRLILVHGRAQQAQDPDALKSTWMAALEKGAQKTNSVIPVDLEIVFPYYGDVLDGFAQEMEVPLTVDVQTRGVPVDEDFLSFQAEVADDLRQRAGITDTQVNLEFGNQPGERGPLNWRWVQAILRALDKHGGGMSQTAIEIFLRDVFLYTNRAGVRDEINRIVAAAFSEEPAVVVGHSLGSVVAFSILRTDSRPLQVPLLVTLGSPLGIRAVRNQFRPLRYPAPVEAWYNAFDRRDVVALYSLDSTSFPISPPVVNNDEVENHTENRHGISGYLDDATVAGRILQALGAST